MIEGESISVNPLEVYREIFKTMLEEKRTGRITNSTISHAIVLIEELLNSAHETFDIYCHCMGKDVWCREEILRAISLAFDRGVVFRVVIQVKPENDNSALKLLNECGGSLRIDKRTQNEEAIKFNFVIADKTAFRFEPECDKREGVAYASNESIAQMLNAMFNELFERGEPYEV